MERGWKPWLRLGGLAAGLGLGLVPRFAEGEDPPARPTLRVLFPADRSVLETGQFNLIGVWKPEQEGEAPPELQVDGKGHPWEPYRRPALVARLKLLPGQHQLQIGRRTLTIFVREEQKPDAPEGWPVFRQHPPTAERDRECHSCHEVQKGEQGFTISPPRTPAACDPCHTALEFEAEHFHPREPLASCPMCHALHGSSRKALLKKPVQELCAACHE